MIEIRPAAERGHTSLPWLDSRHTFSFDQYYDPQHMSFRSLRVINDDRVEPGAGFPRHGHRDMEIVTYMLAGALEHQDSLGNGSVIRPGEVQKMTAGKGVHHSEFNASKTEPAHLLQIWIHPSRTALRPSYEQRYFAPEDKRGRLRLIASGAAGDDAIHLEQDARIYAAMLAPGDPVEHHLESGRAVWIQVATGAVDLNGQRLDAGDGAAVSDAGDLRLVGIEDAELLLFDLQ